MSISSRRCSFPWVKHGNKNSAQHHLEIAFEYVKPCFAYVMTAGLAQLQESQELCSCKSIKYVYFSLKQQAGSFRSHSLG